MTWNLGDLFEQVADALPASEAVVCGPLRLTFADLDRRANRLAAVFAAKGIGPGDHIGLALTNGTPYLEAMLAAFKLRAVPVNVNFRYTAEELHYLFDDAHLAGVLHDAERLASVEAAAAAATVVPWLLAVGGPGEPSAYEDALAAASDARPQVAGRSGDDRYLLYTGGTTGLPKGVEWRHEDVLHGALGGGNPGAEPVTEPAELVANAVATAGRTRCLPASPFTHGTAHWMAFSTLFAGGTVVIAPEAGLVVDHLWDLVEREAVTLLVIVGDAFARPLADALDAEPDRWDLSHLLVVISGGAVLSPSARNGLLAHLPGAVVVDGYGTSETGGQGNMAAWPGQPARSSMLPRFSVGDDTAVLDDRFQPVRPGRGQVGRLARRGHIPIGYWGDPERTARTFPVVDGVRWAVPGDLAMVEADGAITLLGRGSASINSGGEKVFPDEVEATLKEHPAVFDAVVVGIDDERWGQRVAAVVQLRPGSGIDADVLVEHCRAHLAGFKVPRKVLLVDDLVRRASGKPDYAWVRTALQGAAS
jgi:acyl-CoA synthetase (AMP-forming)/AMP-acid ligase II